MVLPVWIELELPGSAKDRTPARGVPLERPDQPLRELMGNLENNVISFPEPVGHSIRKK